eukprot:1335600-Rhodomonas_salina.1
MEVADRAEAEGASAAAQGPEQDSDNSDDEHCCAVRDLKRVRGLGDQFGDAVVCVNSHGAAPESETAARQQ